MQGKVWHDHYEWNVIDWPNSQNHFGYENLEPNPVIQPVPQSIYVYFNKK